MLQGPSSFFMASLGKALRALGAQTHRIHLCPGDWLMWRGPRGQTYRGTLDAWPEHVRAFVARAGITDMVCLGSGRPYHRAAIDALSDSVRVHVIEHGYLRPHWLIVEPQGTGGHSHFPRDATAIRALADSDALPPEPQQARFRTSFAAYAAMDVAWNLANALAAPFATPHYQRHALDSPWREWAGWIRKGLLRPRRRAARTHTEARIRAHAGPLFLMPLQLETDYQIRLHGTGRDLRSELDGIVASFARHAEADALLVVKVHPMDNGWTPWATLVAEAGGRHGVAERVWFLDGGDLDALIGQARGVVTVNSTVGLTAIAAGTPVIALGRAIYDVSGLCHQGPLETFWHQPDEIDPQFFAIFRRALLRAIHVPGGFDGEGRDPGAAAMARRILTPPPYAIENGQACITAR